MSNPRILVIDDDRMIANSLKRVLSYEGFAVRVESDGHAGLAALEEFQPDLVILDVVIPGPSGLEVCRRIKGVSAAPILFLSARDEVEDRVAGLENGGDDYLIKPFAFEELVARVRALLRRGGKTASAAICLADLALDPETRSAARNSRQIDLSATEYQLLHYFLTNPRRVLTREMILNAVWGYDFGGESNIVEVYVRYLRAKLEQGGEPRLIHTVRGAGYIMRES